MSIVTWFIYFVYKILNEYVAVPMINLLDSVW